MVWAILHDVEEADEGNWSTLNLSLPAEDTLQKWDLKCQICAEAVTAKGLRKRMEQKHAPYWQLVRSQVDKLCSAWSTGLHVKVCQFCNSKYDKRYRHAISCHAIMQTALERVRAHQFHQQQGDHGAHSSTGGGPDAGGIRSCDEHGREAGANHPAGRSRLPSGAGRGAGSHGWRANRTSKRATAKNMENEEVGADELLKLLCRVVIRQEDTINILKQSTSWVIFARTEAPSVIPGLVTASQKWKEEISNLRNFFC